MFLNLGVAIDPTWGRLAIFVGSRHECPPTFLKNDIRTEKCWPNSPTYSIKRLGSRSDYSPTFWVARLRNTVKYYRKQTDPETGLLKFLDGANGTLVYQETRCFRHRCFDFRLKKPTYFLHQKELPKHKNPNS